MGWSRPSLRWKTVDRAPVVDSQHGRLWRPLQKNPPNFGGFSCVPTLAGAKLPNCPLTRNGIALIPNRYAHTRLDVRSFSHLLYLPLSVLVLGAGFGDTGFQCSWPPPPGTCLPSTALPRFGHLHNDEIDFLVIGGIFGGAAYGEILAAPLAVARHRADPRAGVDRHCGHALVEPPSFGSDKRHARCFAAKRAFCRAARRRSRVRPRPHCAAWSGRFLPPDRRIASMIAPALRTH